MNAPLNRLVQAVTKINVLELAVAFVIGVAFVAVINSFATDLVLPVVGAATGGVDFSSLSYRVGEANIAYGHFLQTVFSFLMIALSVYLLMSSLSLTRLR